MKYENSRSIVLFVSYYFPFSRGLSDVYAALLVIINNTYTLQVFTLSNITFTGYSGLDTVIFSTSGGTQNPIVNGSGRHFGMDNVCLNFN
jgi:hypothetical protein